jgi:AcrR family transcriptional regulator
LPDLCYGGKRNESMAKTKASVAQGSRRKEYAEATRQAIVNAARKLFREQGYFATKVDEIAALARVAPATVYAVSGGKQGLLRTLVEIWSTAPIIETTLKRSDEMSESRELLRLAAATCCAMRKEYGDIIHVILDTAPHDAEVAKTLAAATGVYRKALVRMGRRLVELGELRKDIDLAEASDVLWIYFGYWTLFTLVEDNGWPWDRAEKWLGDAAIRALLKKG